MHGEVEAALLGDRGLTVALALPLDPDVDHAQSRNCCSHHITFNATGLNEYERSELDEATGLPVASRVEGYR
jgi:hypothetical protein